MLVLSRQRGEVIRIGNEIKIMVVGIRGDKVLLGITAPAGVAVHHREVWQRVREEKRDAQSDGSDQQE